MSQKTFLDRNKMKLFSLFFHIWCDAGRVTTTVNHAHWIADRKVFAIVAISSSNNVCVRLAKLATNARTVSILTDAHKTQNKYIYHFTLLHGRTGAPFAHFHFSCVHPMPFLCHSIFIISSHEATVIFGPGAHTWAYAWHSGARPDGGRSFCSVGMTTLLKLQRQRDLTQKRNRYRYNGRVLANRFLFCLHSSFGWTSRRNSQPACTVMKIMNQAYRVPKVQNLHVNMLVSVFFCAHVAHPNGIFASDNFFVSNYDHNNWNSIRYGRMQMSKWDTVKLTLNRHQTRADIELHSNVHILVHILQYRISVSSTRANDAFSRNRILIASHTHSARHPTSVI